MNNELGGWELFRCIECEGEVEPNVDILEVACMNMGEDMRGVDFTGCLFSCIHA